ncbi:right-handed parallel beta-helix repeat-containing protein [Clostridium aestuarii]|uniref:Right-handed parallel beta-helix repeat-containing protein n=1 Tax=Clostridium aestuarii TaxID=338193 RepID=A0ABT4CVM0_9CLOT|nr:NosD domain-containing protein [Clostridium aestuarii]MCY6482862.1 right-handed parallel beta-helix repeat-containing protein [Clostridium aestuarii]
MDEIIIKNSNHLIENIDNSLELKEEKIIITSLLEKSPVIFLNEKGWSDASAGNWDPNTRTATLIQDIHATIEIDIDNVILNGNNKKIEGSDIGIGIFVPHKNKVTLKNLDISHFSYGILYERCDHTKIVNCKTNHNIGPGILLFNCYNNKLNNNISSYNSTNGFSLSNCHYNKIKNNIIENNFNKNSDKSSNGILLNSTHNTELDNNKFISNQKYGLLLRDCYNADIKNNSFNNNTTALKCDYCMDIYVNENKVFNNLANGIKLCYCNKCTIEDNKVYSNSYTGIQLNGSNSNEIENNEVYNTNVGIELYFSNSNTILENTITDNKKHGIVLRDNSFHNDIIRNIISKNHDGIYLSLAHYNKVYENTISYNINYGIYIYTSSINKIYNNNFINNTKQAADILGNNSMNMYDYKCGNHWSDWTSPDDNYDCIADKPYKIEGGNEDKLPWIMPNGWYYNSTPRTLWLYLNKLLNNLK